MLSPQVFEESKTFVNNFDIRHFCNSMEGIADIYEKGLIINHHYRKNFCFKNHVHILQVCLDELKEKLGKKIDFYVWYINYPKEDLMDSAADSIRVGWVTCIFKNKERDEQQI